MAPAYSIIIFIRVKLNIQLKIMEEIISNLMYSLLTVIKINSIYFTKVIRFPNNNKNNYDNLIDIP